MPLPRNPFCRRALRCLLLILSLTTGLLAACQSPNRELARAGVDSSNTLTKGLRRHISERSRLDTFRVALERAGLAKQLGRDGPYTVFAPTNEAFANAPASFDTLYFGASVDSLRPLLRYHLVYGRYDADRVQGALRIATLANRPLTLQSDTTVAGSLRVQKRAPVERVAAQNGILYVLPALLHPPVDTSST